MRERTSTNVTEHQRSLRNHHHGNHELTTSPKWTTNKKRAAAGHISLCLDQLVVLLKKPKNHQEVFPRLPGQTGKLDPDIAVEHDGARAVRCNDRLALSQSLDTRVS